jgi:L-alanine-DL-glutamate epimerase-like enolase superfamily enzyme
MTGPRIEALRTSAYTIPTESPEADGTIAWNETTLVLVEASAGSQTGIGWTYGDRVVAELVHRVLRPEVEGRDAFATRETWQTMRRRLRNIGRPGLGAMAVAAVDLACWDLQAKLLGQPLCRVLGQARDRVPVYGSGGFTTFSIEQLRRQLGGWVREGIPRVKMKIGSDPASDPERVRAVRDAIGDAALFVDANGAFDREQALAMAERLSKDGVTWFEEPVTSEDIEGLRLLRDRTPAGMDVAAGEYLWDATVAASLIGSVDVLQADITRCEGLTGFLEIAALCDAMKVPLSGHTAPAMHLHAGLAAPALRHLEYFADHVRIERLLFDGVAHPIDGALRPDLSRPGHGVELKRSDARRYAV